MIIGTPKDMPPSTHFSERVFVSQPHYKIVFTNGLGFYIMNSYNYKKFPKFYAMFRKEFWELGLNFLGWLFEIQWNKSFKATKHHGTI